MLCHRHVRLRWLPILWPSNWQLQLCCVARLYFWNSYKLYNSVCVIIIFWVRQDNQVSFIQIWFTNSIVDWEAKKMQIIFHHHHHPSIVSVQRVMYPTEAFFLSFFFNSIIRCCCCCLLLMFFTIQLRVFCVFG